MTYKNYIVSQISLKDLTAVFWRYQCVGHIMRTTKKKLRQDLDMFSLPEICRKASCTVILRILQVIFFEF